MNIHFLGIIVIAAVTCLLHACGQKECDTSLAINKLNVRCYKKKDGRDTVLLHCFVNRDSDSIVPLNEKISGFSLPLLISTDTISYTFGLRDPADTLHYITDTLFFTYMRKPKFISYECGFSFSYDSIIYSVTHHNKFVDTLKIDSVNSNQNAIHLKLYF